MTTLDRELTVLSGIWRYAIALKDITGVKENIWRDPVPGAGEEGPPERR